MFKIFLDPVVLLYSKIVILLVSALLRSDPLKSLESRGRRVDSGECDHRSNAFRIKK